MADCTCADPNKVAQALNGSDSSVASKISSSTEWGAEHLDQTIRGDALGVSTKGTGIAAGASNAGGGQGEHGAIGSLRFCNWAAPEYGTQGESLWTNLWQAAQLAIALLNATIQQQIADKQMDLAEGYYDQAKFKLDRFMNKYKPLEVALLKEVSTAPEPTMNCEDDRSRAEQAVNTSYDYISKYVGVKAKQLRLCIDDSIISQLDHGRALMLVDTENYNLRDDTWFTDYKSDKRWGRRSNVLNLGRNLGSIAKQYGDVSRAMMADVSGLANKAAGALTMALGYYGTRFDTAYPTTYLGSAGGAGNIMNVGTANVTTNAAAGGF